MSLDICFTGKAFTLCLIALHYKFTNVPARVWPQLDFKNEFKVILVRWIWQNMDKIEEKVECVNMGELLSRVISLIEHVTGIFDHLMSS